jgi:integrase
MVDGVSGQVVDRVAAFLLSSLRGQTPEKYQTALDAFNCELASAGLDMSTATEEQLDYMLADHIIDVFEEHGTSEGLGRAALTIAACSRVRPRHKYKTAFKVMDVWRVRCPARQAPTFPPEVALGVVSWLCMAGYPALACAVLLCFSGLLRASEALHLKWDSMIFTSSGVVLILGLTKRGQEQKVLLENPSVVKWLLRFRKLFFEGDLTALVVPYSYTTFSRWLQKGCAAMGFAGTNWTSHGLRRGGASELLRLQVPIAVIMNHGRWLSERSCREYLRRGEVAVYRMRESIPISSWRKTKTLASLGHLVFDKDFGTCR